MHNNIHAFHIPVMGTGHSVDSPIRVAHYGINSVISIVDDLLLEKIRKYYCTQYDFPYKNIPRSAKDGRAKRTAAYLELVQEIVSIKFDELKSLSIFDHDEKRRYFELLPDGSVLKNAYEKLMHMNPGQERKQKEQELTQAMKPGSIDVNIMAKVDSLNYDKNDKPLSKEYSDASAALRGYASTSLSSALVLSAGFNPRLYSYLSDFKDFYRDKTGDIKKKIVLKVSDFRSALIQGKFLAKKGLEVSEFRIESGLNCGGHAFASDGHLLPILLQEFKERKEKLSDTFRPLVNKFYDKMGWEYPESAINDTPSITVQGGIGTHGELRRLLEDFEMDGTGWGSPFLLVPEATNVDGPTRELLEHAGENELYLSNVSPLGVPFNNVRQSGSEIWTKKQVEKGKPGSGCPKGFLVSNTEFTEKPICTASSEYQLLKIDQIEHSDMSAEEKENKKNRVMEKSCLCGHLGNGAMINLGILKPSYGKQAICPGPNVAWFDRQYSLDEMVDHIYGRRESLVPDERPHMFAKELVMYVDYIEEILDQIDPDNDEGQYKKMNKMRKNLEKGMKVCLDIADSNPYPGENLQSIKTTVENQQLRLSKLFERPKVEKVMA